MTSNSRENEFMFELFAGIFLVSNLDSTLISIYISYNSSVYTSSSPLHTLKLFLANSQYLVLMLLRLSRKIARENNESRDLLFWVRNGFSWPTSSTYDFKSRISGRGRDGEDWPSARWISLTMDLALNTQLRGGIYFRTSSQSEHLNYEFRRQNFNHWNKK